MIHPSLYNTDIVDSNIRISFEEKNKTYIVSWGQIQGATGYSVYAGFDPFHIKALISGETPLTVNSFSFSHKPLMATKMVYFWVKYYTSTNTNGTFINEKGCTIYDSMVNGLFNDPNRFPDDVSPYACDYDSKYAIEEFRRRAKVVVYDAGEEVQLYLKQWHGLPSPNASQSMGLYPDYQGMTRDDLCYGTGFYPGYFPAINIMCRFNNNTSALSLSLTHSGITAIQDFNATTMWEPILNSGDVIFRPKTGDKYFITDMQQTNYRGVVNIQRFNIKLIEPTHPVYQMKNDELIAKWQNINIIDYLRIGFNVMIGQSSDVSKYFIF